jgi:hypothetical protein
LLVAGVVLAIAAASLFFVAGISLEVYAFAILAVWVVLFTVAMVASFRYLNSL